MNKIELVRIATLQLLGAFALSFLFISLAPAATMTFTMNTPAGNFTKSYTIPDADMGRLYNVMALNYATPVQTGVDAQGNAVTRVPTRAEVLTRVFDGLMKGWRAQVLSTEQQIAAKAEADKIAPIVVPTVDTTP